MGANSSKTSLERRNTITRRSQRRSIHNIGSRVDKVFMEVKRFDGVEEDDKFRRLMFQMDHLRNELLRKQRDLQPQVRRYFQTILDRLDDAEEALEDQLEDNREYFKERQDELQERSRLRQEMLESPKNNEVDKNKGSEVVDGKKRGIFRKKKEKPKNESDEEDEGEDDNDVEPESTSNRNTKNLDESDDESDKEAETKYKRGNTKRQADSEEETDEEPLQDISKRNSRSYSQSEEDKVKGKSLKNKKNGKVKRVYNDIEIEEDNGTEADKLSKSSSKRKTVELNFVKIIPEERKEPEVQTKTEKKLKSPDEKRKSILKMGIPVMPAAMMNFITKKSKKASVKYNDNKSENNNVDIVQRVNTMINELQTIEGQVADFVGKKYGTQYNRIRDKLNHHLVELCQMKTSDEFELEQIKLCRNYVSSCMNFLDDKAVEVRKQEYEDDVFLPRSGSSSRPTSPVARATSPVQVQEKLHKLSKTTAI